MTATAAANRTHARTGGPKGGPEFLEHVPGRTPVVVLAVSVTRAGLM